MHSVDRAGGPLLLIGAGGLGRETAQAARDAIAAGESWTLLGFLDDRLAGSTVDGLPVLDEVDAVVEHPDARVLLCTAGPGRRATRREIANRLNLPDDRFATLIHPTAVLSDTSVVGVGGIYLAGSVATTSVTTGRHVVAMPGVVLTHDCIVDDHATLASRAVLGGSVRVGDAAYIGAAAAIREGRTVGRDALVGMGAVVVDDVPPGETWVGNPARLMSSALAQASTRSGT